MLKIKYILTFRISSPTTPSHPPTRVGFSAPYLSSLTSLISSERDFYLIQLTEKFIDKIIFVHWEGIIKNILMFIMYFLYVIVFI